MIFSLAGNEPGVKFSGENLFIKVVGREYIYALSFIGSSQVSSLIRYDRYVVEWTVKKVA